MSRLLFTSFESTSGTIYPVSVVETNTSYDAINTNQALSISVNEPTSATSSLTTNTSVTISESNTSVDIVTATAIDTIVEYNLSNDNISTKAIYVVSITEVNTITDSIVLTFPVSVVESKLATDNPYIYIPQVYSYSVVENIISIDNISFGIKAADNTTRTWQSRLVAKNNTVAKKTINNNLINAGIISDVLIIRESLNLVNDVVSYDFMDIDMINIVFPPMVDIPIWRFFGGGQNQNLGIADLQANDSATDKKTAGFECFVGVSNKIDRGSIILRFFDTPQGTNSSVPNSTEPWVLPLQVKDVKGGFGGRSMVYQKIILGYLDGPLPTQFQNYITQMSNRRQVLGW